MKYIISESQYRILVEEAGQRFGYHITSRNYLDSIMENGLIPKVPFDMEGEVSGVYLFKSIEDAEDAMYNWFGERISNIDDYEEVLLKIDLSGLGDDIIGGAGYELICLVPITPDRIIDIIDL